MATRKRLNRRRHRRGPTDKIERKIDRLTALVKGIAERLDDPVDVTRLKAALGKFEKSTGNLKDAVDQNKPKG